MNTQTSQQLSLEEQLERLQEKLQNGEARAEDFREAVNSLDKARQKLQQLLEWATDQRKNDKELKALCARLAGENASGLIESLRQEGYSIRKKPNLTNLQKAFQNQGFRLMEQTRAGNKSAVHYALLRLYVTHGAEFPKKLVEPFKPVYSIEMFKVLILSFLSGVLGKEEE
jgi:hypothetical protein